MTRKRDEVIAREDASWNAWVAGQASFYQVDSTTTSTIIHAHAIDDATPPDPAFVQSLRVSLRQMNVAPASVIRETSPHSGTPSGLAVATRNAVRRSRWFTSWQPVCAAALILILAAGLLFLYFGRDGEGGDHFASGPTITAPTVAVPTTAGDVLFDGTIPTSALPSGSNITSGVAIDTIPIGVTATWTPKCCQGPIVECVLTGSMTVQSSALSQIARSDGSVEDIPVDTIATFAPGDCLISDNETPSVYANVGTEPVLLFHWLLIETTNAFNGHFAPGWMSLSGPEIIDPLDLAAEPVHIQIRQMPVQNKDVIEPFPGGYQLVALDDKYAIVLRADEVGRTVVTNPGQTVTAYVVTFAQAGFPPATPTP